jgi:hypothetical protein
MTLVVHSNTRETAVLHAMFEGQRDRGHSPGGTHSYAPILRG